MVAGLLAPELVAWNAFEQRRNVKRLKRDMYNLYREMHDIQLPDETHWYHAIQSRRSTVQGTRRLKEWWRRIKVFLLIQAEDLDFSLPADWLEEIGTAVERSSN